MSSTMSWWQSQLCASTTSRTQVSRSSSGSRYTVAPADILDWLDAATSPLSRSATRLHAASRAVMAAHSPANPDPITRRSAWIVPRSSRLPSQDPAPTAWRAPATGLRAEGPGRLGQVGARRPTSVDRMTGTAPASMHHHIWMRDLSPRLPGPGHGGDWPAPIPAATRSRPRRTSPERRRRRAPTPPQPRPRAPARARPVVATTHQLVGQVLLVDPARRAHRGGTRSPHRGRVHAPSGRRRLAGGSGTSPTGPARTSATARPSAA